MIEVHILTADDWFRWREMRLASLAEAPYAFKSKLADWQGDRDQEDRWRARLGGPGSCSLLAELDGESAGIAAGIPGPRSGVVELVSMWVRREARGHGVGDRLVRALEQWAVQQQAHTLQLSVVPGNVHALALYRRHDFEDTGQPGGPLPDGGTEVVLAKQLPTL
ncbi:GNAT family N-acetyltransferase [Streptomyces sp. TG1A-8]|uniref:GNAT family N-acetyltransferase n=1 Tax=Streptomyces sp. TG1A-8 TaxID=3051385 RepID=UPI00265C06AC|nr:GNAT family N-acetyltransferase [Streptomyces sp. TG1A-8]MDO0925005.1 GNAT family N-acetyltransferase [Streptomyces sp. TG1A-8]